MIAGFSSIALHCHTQFQYCSVTVCRHHHDYHVNISSSLLMARHLLFSIGYRHHRQSLNITSASLVNTPSISTASSFSLLAINTPATPSFTTTYSEVIAFCRLGHVINITSMVILQFLLHHHRHHHWDWLSMASRLIASRFGSIRHY